VVTAICESHRNPTIVTGELVPVASDDKGGLENMTTKKVKRSTRSIKSLKAKGLSGKQAKSVEGGIIVVAHPIFEKWTPPGPPDMPQGLPEFQTRNERRKSP
jgi:hypothetical protein